MKRNRSVDWLTIKHYWRAAYQFRKDFWGSWLTVVSSLGLTIVTPFYVGKILASLTIPGSDVTGYIIILIITCIISVVANKYSYSALFGVESKTMEYLETEVLTTLMKRGTSYHNNQISGKLVSDASDYPSAFMQLANSLFIDILPFMLIMVFGIVIVAYNSLLIGAVILVMSVLAVGSALHFRHRMAPWRRKRQVTSKAVTAHLADTIVNNLTVKSFGSEDTELQHHKVLTTKLKNIRLHDWDQLALDGAYRILGLLLFQIIFIVIVVHEVHSNPHLLATGIFAFTYTMTLSNRLFNIGTIMRTVEEAFILAMPMTEMFQEEIEIQDVPDALALETSAGRVIFDNVSFHYADNPKNEAVFTDLKLDIHPGEKVGLVGPSGGGKTTLTKLLLRFEDIQKGTISIDDQNIASVTQQSLRRSIAYVPQEPLLFHRTVTENIAYGKPQATEAEIKNAAELAHADDFIMKLPNGYETVVGERGVKLSGGQRQRVAIARAILKDASILVLDEATSALDSESEVAIQAALWELMQGRTTIVVAHRLSTIQRMDRIVVLDDGKIIEQGSHDELLEKNGLYAKLWKHQSGGFIKE